jgi:hypothetical protein
MHLLLVSVLLTATPRDSIWQTVSWKSSNELVASPSSTGLVTGLAPGEATITATSEGVSGSARIIVAPVPPGAPSPGPSIGKYVAAAVPYVCAVIPCPEYVRRAWGAYRWRTRPRIGFLLVGVLAMACAELVIRRRSRMRMA